MKHRAALALALALSAPASALDRSGPAQPLGKVILGPGTSGDGSAIRVQPPAGGAAPTLSEILDRTANPIDFKTPTNTDADTIRALYAKWPDSHLILMSDVTRSYPATNIPVPAQDHVFLWPSPVFGSPNFRPDFPGLHILPIGNRLEIFRGKPRPFEGGEDILMTRDRTNVPGGTTAQQNAQLTLKNKVKDSNSSEWPLVVAQEISGNGLGQHAGISSYSTKSGQGQGTWNFIGGITDLTANPAGNGAAGMELGIRALGPDANRLRTFLDIIGTGVRQSADDAYYNGEIGSGIRIHTIENGNGLPAKMRILKPLNITALWGQNTGALDITTQEKIGTNLGSVFNYMKAFNGDDTFTIRSRRFATSTGTAEHNNLAVDLVRHVGNTGNELAVLSLMPGYVETLNLKILNGIEVRNNVKASTIELDVDNLQVANDNASATKTLKGRFYRTRDGTLKIKF